MKEEIKIKEDFKGGEKMRSLKILIPNVLSGIRFFASGAIFWLILEKNCRWWVFNNYQLAGLILFLALITDLIDGPIARKLNAVTHFGYFFEHILDYLLLIPMIYLMINYLDPVLVYSFLFFQILTIAVSLIRVIIRSQILWPNTPGRISFGFLGASGCALLFFVSTPLFKYFYYLANFLLGIAILLRLTSLVIAGKDFKKEARKNAK